MNELSLLMGLLVLSYLGGFVVERRRARGFGLPSGVEFVALGALCGPHVLGLIDGDMLGVFTPIAHVAVGWLAFAFGLESLFTPGRRVRAASVFCGLFAGVVVAAAVACAAFFVLTRLGHVEPAAARLAAAGCAAALTESARQAAGWVGERLADRGPVSLRLAEVAQASGVVPLVVMGALFVWQRPPLLDLELAIPPAGWWAVSVGLGLVLGLVAAVLLGREARLDESWGVLLGVTLFALGLAVRLDLSAMCLTFFLGLALCALSRHRDEIIAMVGPTERAVMLPALLLAGARIDLFALRDPVTVALVVAIFLARLFAQLFCGGVVWMVAPDARPAGPSLGLTFVPTGMLSIAIALALALRFPGRVGDTALLAAAVIALVGEFMGPAALRGARSRAGESTPGPARTTPPPEPAARVTS